MLHTPSPMMYALKISHYEAQSIMHQQARPLPVKGVAVRSLRGQKIHHTTLRMPYAAPSVLCSNKSRPYGRLQACPCKSSMAASHYCPIKAVGAV